MSYAQIRLNKTKEIQLLLGLLKKRYPILDEVEILKLSLAELYNKERKSLHDSDPTVHDMLMNAAHTFKEEAEEDNNNINWKKAQPLKPSHYV